MALPQPLVLERNPLPALVQYLLNHHEQYATVVFCGAKDELIEQLSQKTAETVPEPAASNERTDSAQREGSAFGQEVWSVPTLRLLSGSRNVKLAFCTDITHFRAYLATYSARTNKPKAVGGIDSAAGIRILAIVNLVNLHRPTSAFSAQGLNRTLSGAVEAAYDTRSKLVIVECTEPSISPAKHAMSAQGDEPSNGPPPLISVWDEEVSILNVTTKSFGAGERGWVGRTVKLRTIAARWCTFSAVDERCSALLNSTRRLDLVRCAALYPSSPSYDEKQDFIDLFR
ncbi:hypothetical protein LTR35_005695 [Friedmanniomyces endolithicus]|uniref:Uncharacterized protein n=2 Tax=Friedmanniomyces endolithicus TaxID=329885 RepID=A0AAN6J7T7_9PEZI|nr:hypothetical protein LTR35_005695 [Friedmanniomyces endolithicus]KAK0297722.1 hypothetical protein LTS00_003855 [Friedmanniomyces endolithicus]KAK0320523.1 hypothetical protein LTR82_008638 [Friedmanniomyces endolithicus]KAK1009127.1 hypothetical protein LTR54_005928 [Friedmanniomyces endolithicus]